ncbi:MAG: hypothetical protein GX638_16790 [Crenarchaeota archaeon]|nr:hypothetical protein [Thermoproteota archaeon]
MGVDWDKYAAGTNIVIVEYNTDMGLYMPIYREEIPRSRFTLGNAVRKVAELNEMYNLDYIYVDRGLGERQVEEFHEYGLANPASGMHEKVKGVTFRDTIKVRDPHTKEVVKKPLKYWMINNAVIIFERGKIALHPSDRLVYKQFSNYRIVSRSMYGYKFSEKDDHIVDALCLALHGLIMHYSDICKVKAGSKLLPVTNIFAKSDRFSVKRKPLIQAVGESFLQPFLRRSKSFGSTKRSRF